MTSLKDFQQMRDDAKTKKFPELHELISVIYGDKKVGKSTFASRYVKPVFLNCEDALRSVRDADGNAVATKEVNGWSDITEFTAVLSEHTPEQIGFQTIVIDGFQEAFQYLRMSILKKHGVDHENDGVLAYGKGKGIIAKELREWFIQLRKLTNKGYGVVITAHSRNFEFDNNGTKYDKKIPFISGGKDEWGWDVVKPCVDLIVYAAKKETRGGAEHKMFTHGTQLFEAADPTPDARLPQDVPFSYAALEKAYNNK